MKKIIGIIIASLVFCNIGFAGISIIDGETIRSGGWTSVRVDVVCIDGFKFIISRNESGTISMVQFFEAGNNHSPKPAKC